MLKKLLALVLAGAMVLGSVSMAFADGEVTAPTNGSITVNSPIMGAQYFGYKVFDLDMDDASNPSAFAYTIDTASPFYKAVNAYSVANPTELKLSEITSLTQKNESDEITYAKYNIDGKTLDAQKFGKFLRDRLKDDYDGDDKITVPTADVKKPTYASGTEITSGDATSVKFENLDFGYYLITNQYDDTKARTTVTLKLDETNKWELNSESTNSDITTAAHAYAMAKYPDETAAQAYVAANPSQFEKTWAEMDATEKAKVLKDLQDTTEAKAIDEVKQKLAAAEADDNARALVDRFVFVDSTTPDAIINEKNEESKWDVPVNPDGHADLPDLPDHDEPKGGKNIIVGETSDNKTVYANSEETNIGDEVHYQLSVNAVNYERDNTGKVQQVKEYIIADYQNKNMEFVPSKKLTVSVVLKDKDGNITQTLLDKEDYTSWVNKGYFFTNTNKTDLTDTQLADTNNDYIFNGTGGIVIPWVKEITAAEAETASNVTVNTVDKAGDEVDTEATGYSFDANTMVKENGKVYKKVPVPYVLPEGDINAGDTLTINGTDYTVATGTGDTLVVTIDSVEYTISGKNLVDGSNNKLQAKTDAGDPVWETDKKYFASLYPNDATILVDYYMVLKDTAVIDGAGNPNWSEFGLNYLDKEDRDYEYSSTHKPGENPPDEPKEPSEKKEKDDAVVYTYALAIKKVDDEGNNLAGAKFKLRGVTAVAKNPGWYKVTAYDHTAEDIEAGTELEMDDKGILVVEGLPQKWAVEVRETVAPDGFNKLTENLFIKPIKTGSEMTTTSKVTYTDEDGNVTESTSTTVEYKDKDDRLIAKKVTYGDKVTYYGADGETALTDDKDPTTGAVTKSAADKFGELIADKYTTVDKNDVTAPGNIAELRVVNNRGTELPSTGGIGTTIFYAGGAILVLLAGVLLVSKRRYA